MDSTPTSPLPSSAPTSTPTPPGEGAPTTAAPPTPAPAPTPEAPVDRYMPTNLSEEQWAEDAAALGMSVAEYKATIAPVNHVHYELGSPNFAWRFKHDPAFSALADNPAWHRGVSSYGQEQRAYLKDQVALIQEMKTLAREQGRTFSIPYPPPLTGEALLQAVERIASQHVPDPNVRRALESESEEVRAELRTLLTNAAQAQHRVVTSLKRMSALRDQWRAEQDSRREQGQVAVMASEVKGLSEAEFQHRYSEIFQKHQEASKAGKWMDKEKWSAELTKLSKARWG